MGMCLEGKGRISIEVRRESFVIHPYYGYVESDDPYVDAFDENASDFDKRWAHGKHPEFHTEDLDDLITALEEAKKYANNIGMKTARRKKTT